MQNSLWNYKPPIPCVLYSKITEIFKDKIFKTKFTSKFKTKKYLKMDAKISMKISVKMTGQYIDIQKRTTKLKPKSFEILSINIKPFIGTSSFTITALGKNIYIVKYESKG